MSDWQTVELGEVAAVRSGYAFSSKDWTSSGIPVVKIANVKAGRLQMGGCSFVSESTAVNAHEFDLRVGDILIAMTGYIGEVALVRESDLPCVLNQRVGKFSVKRTGELEEGFLYAFLSAPSTRQEIKALGYGSAQPNVSPTLIHKIRIPIPTLPEQRGIAATLGALDDKIESNRRVVDILEESLRLKFRVLKMTEPCKAVPLSEVAVISKGVSYKSAELQPSTTSLVTLKSFDRTGGYKVEGLKPYVGKYKPEQVIEPGEIVIAQTDLTQGAEVVGRAVRVPSDSSADTLVASLDLVVIRPRTLSREYLLGVLTDEDFRQHCRSRVNGTTVLHLASDAIPTYEAPVALPVIVEKFTDLARPLLELVDSLNRENKKLVSLRDALLPELLSGRIRVPEAAQAVAEVIA